MPIEVYTAHDLTVSVDPEEDTVLFESGGEWGDEPVVVDRKELTALTHKLRSVASERIYIEGDTVFVFDPDDDPWGQIGPVDTAEGQNLRELTSSGASSGFVNMKSTELVEIVREARLQSVGREEA